jgi:hypothetical protein
MKVYDALRKITWSWSFTTRKDAEEAIKKGHPHNTEHLVVLEPGEEFETAFIDFGNLCRNDLRIQSQYGANFIDGICGTPRLCDDLRVVNPNEWTYHTWMIHKDDAPIFVKRVMEWWNR